MENQIEIWKDVIDFEGIYQVSYFGNIKSLRRYVFYQNKKMIIKEKQLKLRLNKAGYYQINTNKTKKVKTFLVHRLVALAFIPNPENKPQVNHINGIKSDNRVENLEWCTRSENTIHSYNIGLQNGRKGINHHLCKLNNDKILEIRNIGKSKKQKDIAIIYGVTASAIGLILRGKRWLHT
jgi:hypothetical protein